MNSSDPFSSSTPVPHDQPKEISKPTFPVHIAVGVMRDLWVHFLLSSSHWNCLRPTGIKGSLLEDAHHFFLKEFSLAHVVFAFDPAIDLPLVAPGALPTTLAETLSRAPFESLERAAAAARAERARAIVLFGRIIDPRRSSPAQMARLRSMILSLDGDGCRTVWASYDGQDAINIRAALGDPGGLMFVSPGAWTRLELPTGIIDFTILTHFQNDVPPSFSGGQAHRRIVLDWLSPDRFPHHDRDAVHHAVAQRGDIVVHGSRKPVLVSAPANVRGHIRLSSLQPRDFDETPGECMILDAFGYSDQSGQRHSVERTIPTQRVAWRTERICPSIHAGEEELTTVLWAAIESMLLEQHEPLSMLQVLVHCASDISRRIHIASLSSRTLDRVRELFDPRTFRTWACRMDPDSFESPTSDRTDMTGGLPTMVAQIVLERELADRMPPGTSAWKPEFTRMPASVLSRPEASSWLNALTEVETKDVLREAAWLALELLEQP